MKLKLFALTILILPICISAQQNPIVRMCNFLDINYYPKIEGVGGIGTISLSDDNETGLFKNPALLNTNNQINGVTGASSSYFSAAGVYNSGIYFSPISRLTVGYVFNYLKTGNIYSYLSGQDFGSKFYDYYQSIRGSYSLSTNFRVGIGIKHFHSNLKYEEFNLNSYSIDLGVNYTKTAFLNNAFTFRYTFGTDISNIGPKVAYGGDVDPDFIPISLNLAIGLSPQLKISNQLTCGLNGMYQASKYLVPTPPVYKYDKDGFGIVDQNGDYVIEAGKDPNVSVFKGMVQSFYDAPEGTKEELQEIMHRVGIETWTKYNSFEFVLRYGRCLENETKGNRQIRSLGFGFSAYNFKIDYFTNKFLKNNFDNTWGISFGYQFKI